MTSEIAIINSQAVALAADSTVTVSDVKTFTSANKLFTLSKYDPVGIMLFGNATFMGIPWETIIKVYREKLGKKSFDKLSLYATDFLDYLNQNEIGITKDTQRNYVQAITKTVYQAIIKDVNIELQIQLKKQKKLDDKIISDVVEKVVSKFYKQTIKNKKLKLPRNYIKDFRKNYKKFINEGKKIIFEKLPLSKKTNEELYLLMESVFTREGFPVSGIESGLVFAGFGKKEIKPNVCAYNIYSMVNNKLHFLEFLKPDTNKGMAAIYSFAQKEMVCAFMDGIDPNYRITQQKYLEDFFNKFPEVFIKSISNDKNRQLKANKEIVTKLEQVKGILFKEFNEKMKEFSNKRYVAPIMSIVSVLPKDELAEMAETLVNITSFKRRVSTDQETVGGPIDVAVISKGDGFIWIKRKHYFNPELNHHFFNNYFLDRVGRGVN